jgi:hypothetical protein
MFTRLAAMAGKLICRAHGIGASATCGMPCVVHSALSTAALDTSDAGTEVPGSWLLWRVGKGCSVSALRGMSCAMTLADRRRWIVVQLAGQRGAGSAAAHC